MCIEFNGKITSTLKTCLEKLMSEDLMLKQDCNLSTSNNFNNESQENAKQNSSISEDRPLQMNTKSMTEFYLS